MSLLNEIQQKLKAPKNQYNSFGKYNYRNAEDILEAVKPLLGEAVLILTDEVVQVGNRNYVRATARLLTPAEHERYCLVSKWERGEMAVESSKPSCGCGAIRDEDCATGWACESEKKTGMDAAQITGAASSYARKYALNGLFCIDDTKDADSHDNRAVEPSQTAKTAPGRTESTEAENRVKAAKDRILANLKRLGKSAKTKEEIAQAVFDLTGLELVPEKYDEIGEALGKLNK